MNERPAAHFDRYLGATVDLPDTKMRGPTTVREVLPFVGASVTHVVTTIWTPDYGYGVLIERTDKDGVVRIVLPDRVAQLIYRQRKSIVDRSTPASRAAKRARAERTRGKRQQAERKARYAAKREVADAS